MSYQKALTKIEKSDPNYTVTIRCSACPCGDEMVFEDTQLCLTKTAMARDARAAGWTYNDEGHWSCPACSLDNPAVCGNPAPENVSVSGQSAQISCEREPGHKKPHRWSIDEHTSFNWNDEDEGS